jgi:hypothetical protein
MNFISPQQEAAAYRAIITEEFRKLFKTINLTNTTEYKTIINAINNLHRMAANG